MKIFLDSANLEELRSAAALGVIDGVTTNPSLIAREGVATEEQIRRICDIVDGDISAAVISTDSKGMIAEGRRLARIHDNVVVKVPFTRDGAVAVRALSSEGFRLNVTLCFSAAQALLAAKAGAYIVSPFVGRVEDIGASGVGLIDEIITIYSNYGFTTQVLAASLRGPRHVIEVAKAGAHIATMPLKLLNQLFDHPLTDKGLQQFLADYRNAFEYESTRR